MKKLLIIFLFLAMMGGAEARLLLTEVMYAPTQTSSQTDSEWIEIYNDGEEAVDLTDWKVDGNGFDDVVLEPRQYLVVARELVDGSDADEDSFESYWGDNNGIWDENFLAVDGYFSLADSEDTINLSNGIESEVFYYTSDIGAKENGKTIVRVNYSLPNNIENWEEGRIDGTPGRGESSSGNELELSANVLDTAPEIVSLEMTDDLPEEGIQVMPSDNNISVNALIKDLNGIDDVVEVKVDEFNVTMLAANITNVSANFVASFQLPETFQAGTHTLTVIAKDNSSIVSKSVEFEYLSVIATSILPSSITFNELIPGNVTEAVSVSVLNDGNVAIDLEIEGTELNAGNSTLPTSAVEYKIGEDWSSLSNSAEVLGLEIGPATSSELMFRMNIPESTKSATYKGKIRIVARAK